MDEVAAVPTGTGRATWAGRSEVSGRRKGWLGEPGGAVDDGRAELWAGRSEMSGRKQGVAR